MLEKMTKRVALILLSALLLPSCSYYSKTASDQRAYDRYVKKNSGIHLKERQKVKVARARMPVMPPPSPQQTTAEASDGPQSVASGESQNQ